MWYDIEKKRRSDAKAVMDFAIQEGMEKGMEKGMKDGMEKVFSLLRQGYSVDEAEKMLQSDGILLGR